MGIDGEPERWLGLVPAGSLVFHLSCPFLVHQWFFTMLMMALASLLSG